MIRSFALHAHADRPDEAQELAPHSRHDLLLTFATAEQLAIARVQPKLRLPTSDGQTLQRAALVALALEDDVE
jgi:hypothetical protein